jgi:hypothetical protein
MDAASQSRWEDAKRVFQRSYELYPRPLTLLNLAGAQAQSGELVTSSENYRKFIREANAPPASEQKPAAEQALAQVEARLARVKLRVDNVQSDDRIEIDGRRVSAATLGLSVPMDPGEHKVIASRNGAELTRVAFHLDERESRELSLSVPAAAAVAPVASAAPQPAGERRPDWFQPTPEKKRKTSRAAASSARRGSGA